MKVGEEGCRFRLKRDGSVHARFEERGNGMRTDIVEQVLSFWFAEGDSQSRAVWFKTDPSFDHEIEDRFKAHQVKALSGDYDGLADMATGALALVILLDQFPRNLYRGSPEAFASDTKALAIARAALAAGFDQGLTPVQRTFLYLPFEHSEDRNDQEKSVQLFEELGDEDKLKYAIEHREIIERFGRFPHRNAVLGRPSTPEEVEFLKDFDSF